LFNKTINTPKTYLNHQVVILLERAAPPTTDCFVIRFYRISEMQNK